MRTKDLINLEEAYLSVYEASYVPRSTSVGSINVLSDPTKIEGKTKELEDKFKQDFNVLETDPDNLDVAVDILNIMDQLGREHYSINGQTYTEEEIYQKLLDDTKSPNHDYELLKDKTIIAYKKAGGSEAWYHLYKELFKRLGLEAAPYNRRETSSASHVIFFFGVDGEPYKTTIKTQEDGLVHGTAFWKTNQYQGLSRDQLRTGDKSGAKPKPWGEWAPYIDGKTIDEIKVMVRHDLAAAAFEAKFPPLEFPKYYTKR